MASYLMDIAMAQSGRVKGIADSIMGEVKTRNLSQPPAPISQFFENIEQPQKMLGSIRSFSDWQKRVAHNSRLFQTNYLIIAAAFLAFYIVTHPLSVILMCVVAIGCYKASTPTPEILFQGRVLTRQERLIAAAACSTLALCVFNVFNSLFFNFMLSATTVTAHATARRIGTSEKISDLKEKLTDKVKDMTD